MKLLHVDSSILGDGSVSRDLSAAVVAGWRRRVPGLEIVTRDLGRDPLDHLSGAQFAARALPEDQRNAAHHADIVASDAALAEFLAADVVVIGAPMYNFSIPSQLKAWIDRLAIAGKTFKYTETGPVGLAGGKKVIVVSSRGGLYTAGSPFAAFDFQESYLKALFGFLGIDDVAFIRAEGLNLGPDHKNRAIEAAHGVIAEAA